MPHQHYNHHRVSHTLCVVLLLLSATTIVQVSSLLSRRENLKNLSIFREFWQALNAKCQLDPLTLMDLYQSESQNASSYRLDVTLRKELRNSLLDSVTQIYTDALLAHSTKRIRRLSKMNAQLLSLDHALPSDQLLSTIWERVLDQLTILDNFSAMHLFPGMWTRIFDLESTLLAFLSWHRQFAQDPAASTACVAMMLGDLQQDEEFPEMPEKLQQQIRDAIEELPEDLQNLYVSTDTFRILNVEYEEYMHIGAADTEPNKRSSYIQPKTLNGDKISASWLRSGVNSQCQVFIRSVNVKDKQLDFYFLDSNAATQSVYFNNERSGNFWTPQWHAESGFVTFATTEGEQFLCAGEAIQSGGHVLSLQNATVPRNTPPTACRWHIETVPELELALDGKSSSILRILFG